jgi:hypothetical protein
MENTYNPEDESKTYTERYECAQSQRETNHELSIQIPILRLVFPMPSPVAVIRVIVEDGK